VAEREIVNAGAKRDSLSASRQEGELRKHIEGWRLRWDRGVLIWRMRRAAHGQGEDKVLGQPRGLEAKGFCLCSDVPDETGVRRPEIYTKSH
jgi:hypothetical protein